MRVDGRRQPIQRLQPLRLHRPLDARGAQVMQDFQSSLMVLQRSLQAGPDHYWRIYPKSLEASISA